MNQAYPDLIFNGVTLCISIQLMCLALFYFYKNKFRLVVLGVFCFIVGGVFINNIFWNTVKENLLLSLLFGAGKNLLFPPLVYSYIISAQLPKEKWVKHLALHLSFPLMFHVSYMTLKFGFKSFFMANYYVMGIILYNVLFLISLFYLVLAFYHFSRKHEIQLSLRIKKRYQVFTFMVLGYYFIVNLYAVLPIWIQSEFFATNFLWINRYVFMPLGVLANTFILAFSITEFFKFKSLFVPRLLHLNPDEMIIDHSDFEKKLNDTLDNQQLYANPTLSISDLAERTNLDVSQLRQFFKSQHTSFKKYLNAKRVEKFKSLLLDENYQNYSLQGLSTLVGFQSNATFFRVFKALEGITPNEFQKRFKDKL
ncbi:helix-turn-helix domain-containing protein [Flagellimonas flava]|uniref:AraC-type DNA-binding protein n=1 Tax=Flagellimonas flava TaxID=570519 RepID=A0A1M5ISM4_9FLAO|nr:AraC family transcriptional regulator [Allomuricauda flava]SHG31256.1 AraC-type DNA-binding protein [Allomuricauda flava]